MTQPVQKAVFHFSDRERNVGTVTLYCALALSDTDRLAFINLMAEKMQALSNASLTEVRTYYRILYDGIEASADADMTSRVLLYYSEGDTYETIDIPSPVPGLFETEGAYQGIRVSVVSTPFLAWVDGAAELLGYIVTKEGDPFPATYQVGGKSL